MSHPESDRADAYLTIPAEYARSLGGLRWSHGCDAIEDSAGVTLALVDQIGQVLEGVFSRDRVPSFAFVLHILREMKFGASGNLHRFKEACTRVGPAALGRGRNAGVLIAELCRPFPAVANPPSWPQVDLAIKRRMLFGERHRPELAETPPLPPEEFARELSQRLSAFDDPTLAHWLRHGTAPIAGAKLAREIETIPLGIGDFLDLLRKRPRLVGAVTLAPALDAALTFPPRKPRPDRLPQGGYADVANRGNPDQLLPSQFALDGDEFVRRFAERELLYFKREEPHHPTVPERWLVLDQGVRTWGNIRLGLAAAVLALLGKDPKKAGPVRLALTSRDAPIDPAEVSPELLADHLEASDLSVHPASPLDLALHAFADSANSARDVVMLTTPRAVLESAVQTSAKRRRVGDRLFALTVAEDGHAEFGEWGPSGFLPSRKFRVDLEAAAAARTEADSTARNVVDDDGWTGDVEPVAFPFRAGLVSDIAQLGFDASGEWLVIVARDGCVQAKNLLAGTPVEVLPRAYRNAEVLTRVEAVLGVSGGVVLCGKMGVDSVAAHYDFAARGVRLHSLGKLGQNPQWVSFPDLHCIAVRAEHPTEAGRRGGALDLGSGGRYELAAGGGLAARAQIAWGRAISGSYQPSPRDLPVLTAGKNQPDSGPFLDLVSDRLFLQRHPQKWGPLLPMAEGKPLLAGMTLHRAQIAGDVLAVHASGSRRGSRIFLLRGPDARILAEIPAGNSGYAMRLSADGSRFALQTSTRTAVVRGSEPGSTLPLADIPNAGLHSRVTILLEPLRLRIRVGRFEHAFSLDKEAFRHDRGSPNIDTRPSQSPAGYGSSDLAYDRTRFSDPVRSGPWIAAFDKWGQVLLISEKTGKVVLSLVVRRDLAAAWLPDGTRWGATALLGCANSPNASTRIGHALQAASGT